MSSKRTPALILALISALSAGSDSKVSALFSLGTTGIARPHPASQRMNRTPALACHAAAGGMMFAVSGIERQSTLAIFDLRGTAVRKIPMDIKTSVFWDGRDSRGHRVLTGVYAAALQGCSALSFVYGDGKP